jgi:hypothetical protein
VRKVGQNRKGDLIFTQEPRQIFVVKYVFPRRQEKERLRTFENHLFQCGVPLEARVVKKRKAAGGATEKRIGEDLTNYPDYIYFIYAW